MAARFGAFAPAPALLAVFCCLVILGAAFVADCGTGFGCFSAEAVTTESLSRKLLVSSHGDFNGFRSNTVDWELRTVPSGPDPLHHNRSPKKPQTP